MVRRIHQTNSLVIPSMRLHTQKLLTCHRFILSPITCQSKTLTTSTTLHILRDITLTTNLHHTIYFHPHHHYTITFLTLTITLTSPLPSTHLYPAPTITLSLTSPPSPSPPLATRQLGRVIELGSLTPQGLYWVTGLAAWRG